MKVEFDENSWGGSIQLIPESVEETAQLLRFTKNAKAEKPTIRFYFNRDIPYCFVEMAKIKESVQTSSISNK